MLKPVTTLPFARFAVRYILVCPYCRRTADEGHSEQCAIRTHEITRDIAPRKLRAVSLVNGTTPARKIPRATEQEITEMLSGLAPDAMRRVSAIVLLYVQVNDTQPKGTDQ